MRQEKFEGVRHYEAMRQSFTLRNEPCKDIEREEAESEEEIEEVN